MRYELVYALLRSRMTDDSDIPTTDEIIAAALDVAREAIGYRPSAVDLDPLWQSKVRAVAIIEE